MPSLEIACFNAESALIAQSHGAHRIELCAEQSLGGTSPSLSTFQAVKTSVSIAVNVMIRPRGGDFVYTSSEFEIMKAEIEEFKRAAAGGFVFGILTQDGKVDGERCRDLVERAEGKPCTFHRAFDLIAEEGVQEAIEKLVEVGFKAVLTSGGKGDAMEGKEVLKRLVEIARGRVEIIVGGGVRSGDLRVLRDVTGAQWYHSSAVLGGGDVADKGEVERLSALAM